MSIVQEELINIQEELQEYIVEGQKEKFKQVLIFNAKKMKYIVEQKIVQMFQKYLKKRLNQHRTERDSTKLKVSIYKT